MRANAVRRARCVGWIVTALLVINCGPSGRDDESGPYLHAAIETGTWLEAVSGTYGEVRWWPEWVEQPERANPTLGSGVGGPVLFFLALAEATGDDQYTALALEGGGYLLDTLPAVLATADQMRSPGSLYGGLPSVALTLAELYRATGDSAFQLGALATTDRVIELARPVADGIEWSPYNDLLFGSAGTGLFLIRAAEDWGHPAALALASEVGATLLDRAEERDAGVTWSLRSDREIYLPNFSHGGAGIGFFLLRLSQATGDERYRTAALRAAGHLKSIARIDDGGFILPYSVPNGEFNYSWDIGWAHGPAGAARFFYALWLETGDRQWLDLVDRSVIALQNAGVPAVPQPEFDQDRFRNDLRFGQAGVAMLLLDLYQATGEAEYLDYGRVVVDSMLARATRDSLGARWTIPQYGFMPEEGEPATFTGYFYGAAGFGLTLLRMDGVLHEQRWDPVLPDNPF